MRRSGFVSRAYSRPRSRDGDGSCDTHRVFEATPPREEDDEVPPSSSSSSPLSVEFVADIVRVADSEHAGVSARIERCRASGVDYLNGVRYTAFVASLYASMRPEAQFRVVCNDVTYEVRIVIGNRSDVEGDVPHPPGPTGCIMQCPLCLSAKHRLALCPHLPDDLRPFARY
jgi:hypothetical protein